jgi:ParB family transcriptional regulator, chromosome partitioning protein
LRPLGEGYEIVAGERRYRAASEAGLSSVPAIVRELSEREALEIALIENLQREDLSPLEEARAFEALLGFGLSQEELASAVGKSRSAVANALRLLKLPKRALEALERGEISAGHARAILAQPEADQDWALEQILSLGLSVRQAERLKRPVGERVRSEKPSLYDQIEHSLAEVWGTKVRIIGERKGKVELHFYSRDDLDRLLELLNYRT